jgi:hydroxymethylbilane synthase
VAESPAALRLGTRGSQLALWQANAVAARLKETTGGSCRIIVIKTSGDRLQDAPLSEVGGKRLFVKEIEEALLQGEIDLAVHSSKDMPVVLPRGLIIGAALPREDPLDAVVLPQRVRLKPDTTYVEPGATVVSGFSRTIDPMSFDEVVSRLGDSPTIGTSSIRRIAQLTRLFPRAHFAPIRGNLDTRLRKLDNGEYDALILAAAGLRRLGMAFRISATTPASACVPAPGQGIISVEIRDKDPRVSEQVRLIDDPRSHAALDAERSVVEALGGGCQTPIGVLASMLSADEFEIVAVVASVDGSRAIAATGRGKPTDAAAIGAEVGAQLLGRGAAAILAEADLARGAVEGIQP